MEQTGTLGLLGIKTEFGCHNSTKIGCFARMLEKVLSIRTAILHLTNDTNEFGMQTMDSKIDGCALTGLDNLVLKLFLHLLHHLFNSCRMDTAIGYKLMERKTANLTTDGVESANDN